MPSDQHIRLPIMYNEEIVNGGKLIVEGELLRAFSELNITRWVHIFARSSLENLDITYTALMELLDALTNKRYCYNYLVDEIHDKKTTLTATGQSNTYTRWVNLLNATEKKMDQIKIMYTKYKEIQQKKRSSCFPIFYSSSGPMLVKWMEWAAFHLFFLADYLDYEVVKYLISHLYRPNTRIRIRKQPISPQRLSCIANDIKRDAYYY